MNKSPNLIIPIKKIWFYMIYFGIKTEEYREIKPYWEKRFQKIFGMENGNFGKVSQIVLFRNGYGNHVPQFYAEVTIVEKKGNAIWGAEKGITYYTLNIRRVFNASNMPSKDELKEIKKQLDNYLSE